MSWIRSLWKRWFSWITISRWLIALCFWAASTQVTYPTLDSLSFVGWINISVLSLCTLALLLRIFIPATVLNEYKSLSHSLLASDAVAITFISWGVLININGVLDSSEPERRYATVVEVIEEPLSLNWFYPAGRAALASRHASNDLRFVALRNNNFSNLLTGQEITFTQYEGLLGLPWITDVSVNHNAVPQDLLTSEDPIVRKDIALAKLHGTELEHELKHSQHYALEFTEDVDFMLAVTDVLLKRNQAHRAVAFLKPLISIRPNYELHVRYGELLQQIGDRSSALEIYQVATTLNPKPSAALYHLGYSLKAAGRFEEATIAFIKLLEIEPGYPLIKEAVREMQQTPTGSPPVS